VKKILIHDHPTKLYSLDGKLWFTKPGDFKQFKRRAASAKTGMQKHLAGSISRKMPIATYDPDFWR
jgi:hypothetical protein